MKGGRVSRSARPKPFLQTAALAAVILASLGGAGRAADLGEGRLAGPAPYGVLERSAAIVVPDCFESYRARLLRCAPREEVRFRDDLGLIAIERAIRKPWRPPYPQLVDRP